jgi:hypothetical protein
VERGPDPPRTASAVTVCGCFASGQGLQIVGIEHFVACCSRLDSRNAKHSLTARPVEGENLPSQPLAVDARLRRAERKVGGLSGKATGNRTASRYLAKLGQTMEAQIEQNRGSLTEASITALRAALRQCTAAK